MTQEVTFEREAVEAANKFVRHFCDFVDKSRQFTSKFYFEDSVLSWNGNLVRGLENISKFYSCLPNSTHTFTAFDAQPIALPGSACPAIFITASGFVDFPNIGSRSSFHRSFVLVTREKSSAPGGQENTSGPNVSWKILSDTFRLQQVENRKS